MFLNQFFSQFYVFTSLFTSDFTSELSKKAVFSIHRTDPKITLIDLNILKT